MVPIACRESSVFAGTSQFARRSAHLCEQETALLQAIGVVPAATFARSKRRGTAKRIAPLQDSAVDLVGKSSLDTPPALSIPTALPCKARRRFLARQRQKKTQVHDCDNNTVHESHITTKHVSFSLSHNTVRHLPSPCSKAWRSLEASFVQTNINSCAARAFGAYYVCSMSGRAMLVFPNSDDCNVSSNSVEVKSVDDSVFDSSNSDDVSTFNTLSLLTSCTDTLKTIVNKVESDTGVQTTTFSSITAEDIHLRKIFFSRLAPRSALKRPKTTNDLLVNDKNVELVTKEMVCLSIHTTPQTCEGDLQSPNSDEDCSKDNIDQDSPLKLSSNKLLQRVQHRRRRLLNSWKSSAHKILGKVAG